MNNKIEEIISKRTMYTRFKKSIYKIKINNCRKTDRNKNKK
jgi:hypothetical protein